MATNSEVDRLADACVRRLPSQAADAPALDPGFQNLLDAIRQSDARFAFEREGRPAAIAAVREALPVMERDLYDAVVEDHACEIAAMNEAIRVMGLALARLQGV